MAEHGTSRGEQCTDQMREHMGECEKERNQKARYDADDEWHLSIGGSGWDIGNMKMGIWTATSHECLRRGDTPKDGLWVAKGHFDNAIFNYFDEIDKNFAPRCDQG